MPDKKPKYQTLPEVTVKAKKKPSQRAIADETYLPKPKILPRKPGVDSGFRAPYEPEQYVNYPFRHYETLPEVVVHSKTKNKYKNLPNVTVTSKKKSPIKQAVESTGIEMYNPDTKRKKSTANPGQTKSQIKQSTSNIKGDSLKESLEDMTAITQFAPFPLISIPSMVVNSGLGLMAGDEARRRGDEMNQNINQLGAAPWKRMFPGWPGKVLEGVSAAADLTDNFGLEEKKNGGWLDNYGEEANPNEGYSSAPKEWIGEGYSNVGRNYSPAWGGQFEEGGMIPQAQNGRPTSADSLNLYNSQIALNKFYENEMRLGRLHRINPYVEQSHDDLNSLKDSNLEFYRQQINIRGPYGSAFDREYGELFNLTSEQVKKLELEGLRVTKSDPPYQAHYRDLVTPLQNLAAPFALVDSRIKPQGKIAYEGNDHYPGGSVTVFNYDPLAIKPYNMRTPQEKIEWEKKYGRTVTRTQSNGRTVWRIEGPMTDIEQVPSLKKKVTKMEPIPSKGKSTTPQLRTIEQPNIELPAVERGQYRTSYYDPQMKDWNERAFMTQKESDQFADEMSKRGYPGSYGNVTQRTQFQLGGNVYPVNYIPQAQDGITSEDSMLNNIYSKWPALKKLGDVSIKADESFTRDKTGVGDIEFFSPNTPQVTYSNGYVAQNPGAGGYGILYNPSTNDEQNIRLDMLHGMAEADPRYRRLRNRFERAVGHTDIKNEMNHWYNIDKEKGEAEDGREKWMDNYTDGQLRTLLYEGDRSKQNYSDEEANQLLSHPRVKRKFNKLNNYLQKGEFGGSIPGSVGFTYARTNSPAPSNGPYAKKTKASAQDGKEVPIDPTTNPTYAQPLDESLQYVNDWMNSPMYKQMLSNSLRGRKGDYKNLDRRRKSVVEDGKINYYEESIDPRIGAESNYVGKGKSNMYFNKDADYPDWYNNILHELFHITDAGGLGIPLSDQRLMRKYATHDIKDSPFYESAKATGTLDDLKKFTNYVNAPSETRARINNLRKLMRDQEVYDPFTQSFSKDMFDKYKQLDINEEDKKAGHTIGPDPYQQLRMSYTDEEIEDMMNKISKADNNQVTPIAQNGMTFYQHGLDWKPKTISKNGGWLDKYIPEAQGGLNIPGVTDFKMPLNRTDAPGLSIQEKQRQDAAALEIQRRNEATAKRQFVGQGQASTPESERSRAIKNKAYAAQNAPYVNIDENANLSQAFPDASMTGELRPGSRAAKTQEGIDDMITALEYAGYAEGLGTLGELGYGALKKGISTLPGPKTITLSKMLDNSKLNTELANNLYANRILQEELIAPNVSYRGTANFPEGKLIDHLGSPFLQKNGRMYYITDFENGVGLNDVTYDFMPRPGDKYPSKYFKKLQKKYNVSDAAESEFKGSIHNNYYPHDETVSSIDDWIIHNDTGQIPNNRTWWKKGSPYGGAFGRSLFDKPFGRHIYAKQSALESALERPLDQHRELMGDIIEKGRLPNNGLTITPTGESFLPNIQGVKTFTYNPLTKSMERGIFKKKQGGVIKDDRGQWDHPGEITEIGSNRITMQGVPYPVLGVSDENDVQMMYPGEEYKFKGKKVTEFPMAQNGYTTDPNDYSRWQDSVNNYNESMAHLAASRKKVKKNIDDFSVLSKEGVASAIGNLFNSDVRKIRPKYSESDLPRNYYYNETSTEEQPTRVIALGDQTFYGGYVMPGTKSNMYNKLNINKDNWYNSHEFSDIYSDMVKIYPPPVRKNLQLVNPQKKVEKPKPTPPEPTLKRKPVKMETIKSKSSTSTPGIKTMSGTPVKEQPVPKRGEYRVSYYNPDIKDWSEQAFETEKESDKFADEMSKRGYGSGAGNVTQTRKVNKKENGGWLSQYK